MSNPEFQCDRCGGIFDKYEKAVHKCGELDQQITETEYKLALLVVKRQYPNSALLIEEYVKQLIRGHNESY